MPLLAIDSRKWRKPVPSTSSDYAVNLKKLTLKSLKCIWTIQQIIWLCFVQLSEQIYLTTHNNLSTGLLTTFTSPASPEITKKI